MRKILSITQIFLKSYLFQLFEKVLLKQCLLTLLLGGEPYELLGAVRFDAHAHKTSLTNRAENNI